MGTEEAMKSRGAEAFSIGQWGMGSFVLQQGMGQFVERKPPYPIWHCTDDGSWLTVKDANMTATKTSLSPFFILDSLYPSIRGKSRGPGGPILGLEDTAGGDMENKPAALAFRGLHADRTAMQLQHAFADPKA